jgi:DNA-binding CsgD family transcriptional regulator/catechol 2,3-dioxygenase-like lactoylglutathione lyase family enzyme
MKRRGQRGRPPHPDLLTPAEWQVTELVRHGLSNSKIAGRRQVSVDAVKYHVANILQKLGFSNRGALRSWDGICRDSHLFGKARMMHDDQQLGMIGQVARSVKDIEEATEWYRNTLGLPHLYSFGNLAFFNCSGVRLFLSQGEGGAAESVLYFQVGDIHAAATSLEARGVKFTHAPHMIHRHENGREEWMAFFEDNEKRPLAIMAQVDQ